MELSHDEYPDKEKLMGCIADIQGCCPSRSGIPSNLGLVTMTTVYLIAVFPHESHP